MTIFLYKTVRTKNPAIDANAPKWILGFTILSLVSNAAWAQTQAGSPRSNRTRGGNGDLVGALPGCHGPEQKKGGLDLSRRAAALKGGKSGVVLVPGSPAESTLVDRITDGEMPPKNALAADQIETVRAWVQGGAIYPSEPLAVPRAG